MKSSTLRQRILLPCLLALSLCLSLLCAAPDLKGQITSRSAASAIQPFDATSLTEPVEVGTVGLVQAGDNPAWAQPDFDDSKWLRVDDRTPLKEYFPGNQLNIVWRRLRIKVNPADPELALQAFAISRAFELYVNGEKLMESGGVEPFVPYTRIARLIVPISKAQLRTGSLVIAIRARVPRTWWTNAAPGFRTNMLTVGDEGALRDRNLLTIIGENAVGVLESLVALGVGLVALALFIAQRNQVEYLWIFLFGACDALYLATLVGVMRDLPAGWWTLTGLMSVAEGIAIVLVFQAFLRERFSGLLWLFIVVALLIRLAIETANLYGIQPAFYNDFYWVPFGIVLAVVLPLLVWRQVRRGNREAGILLIPLFFYSVDFYAFFARNVLMRIPPLHSAGNALQMLFSFQIGIFRLNLDDVGSLIFFFSLAVIMVLRSVRISRQQAVLEGEMAAAREVQQVILPEQVEAVPGFTVESEYRPAREVGGDFFQIIPHKTDGSLLIVAGDVTGKGLKAGMLVALLVGAIRTAADTSVDPAFVLHALNERLLGRGEARATCIALSIAKDGKATLANAGHLPPYLNGEPIAMEGALPLGMIEGAEFSVMQFQLKNGERLVLMSDGIVEATNRNGQLFGFERVHELLRTTTTAAEVASAAQGFGQEDDISVISVTRTAVLEPSIA